MRWVFRDALLHTTVVMCGCFTLLSALSNLALLLWPLSLTRPAELLLTRCFLFFAQFSLNSVVTVVCENPRRSTLSSQFWRLVWKTAEPLDHVCVLLRIQLLPHGWLIRYSLMPNKVVTVCMFLHARVYLMRLHTRIRACIFAHVQSISIWTVTHLLLFSLFTPGNEQRK